MQLVFATRNPHKLVEVRALFADSDLEIIGLEQTDYPGDPPETGTTFVHNALQKARAVRDHTGLACVADDSGLEVDALGGAPGVFSKRFSDAATAEANNALLLERLAGVTDRTARFRCVLALVTPTEERTAEGSCPGRIGHEHRGTGGFGYDPLFLPDEAPGRSMAELSMDEKNAISHRGRAFRHLPELVAALF